jgi:hypothetical protein
MSLQCVCDPGYKGALRRGFGGEVELKLTLKVDSKTGSAEYLTQHADETAPRQVLLSNAEEQLTVDKISLY